MHTRLPTFAYIIINLDPTFTLGPFTIHWYGVAYVVAILAGLWAILRYARRLGMDPENVYKVFWWAALAGLIGGRLYFVIQQPHLVDDYLKDPINIIAVWKGGMAFFGAIFLGLATVAYVSWRQKIPVWLAMDIAAYFAAVGQIFGRFGNLVNGDIVGYQAGTLPSLPDTCLSAPCIGIVSNSNILPWATVYVNHNTFAPPNTPVQPAAFYEMLMNLILLAILIPLLLRLPRIKMGLVSLVYLIGYALSQLIVFFFRGSELTTPFLGITIFKQAQWTAIIVLLLMVPYYFFIQRTSRPWTKAEAAALAARQGVLDPSVSKGALAEAPAEDEAPEAEQKVAHSAESHAAHHQKAEHQPAEPSAAEHEAAPAEETTHHAGRTPHEQAAALHEQGFVADYTDRLAAELRTEGIEVTAPPAEEPTAADGATETSPAKNTRGPGSRAAARRPRSKNKQADEK